MRFRLKPFFSSSRRLVSVTLAFGALSGLCAIRTTALAAPTGDPGVSGSAAAAPAASSEARAYQTPTWATYYDAIDAIRADSAKTQAELDNLKIHHQLEEARHGNFSSSDGPAAPTQPSLLPNLPGVSTATKAPASESVEHDALVEQVSMVDNQWTADIRLPSGARVSVRQGQGVKGLGKITSISLHQVIASDGGKEAALQFAGDAPQESAVTTTAGARTAQMVLPIGMR